MNKSIYTETETVHIDSSYIDIDSNKQELNTSLNSLGCSPIKLVAQEKRISYGKRKLEDASKAAQIKIASIFGNEGDHLKRKQIKRMIVVKKSQIFPNLWS